MLRLGSFNAINASKRAFEVSNFHSRVQRVKDYLDAVQAVSDLQASDDPDLDALDDAIELAAEKAATASSQPVTAGMLDEVNAISDDKELTEPGMINPLDQGTTEDIAERAND